MQLNSCVLDRVCEVLQREQETWFAVIPPAKWSRFGNSSWSSAIFEIEQWIKTRVPYRWGVDKSIYCSVAVGHTYSQEPPEKRQQSPWRWVSAHGWWAFPGKSLDYFSAEARAQGDDPEQPHLNSKLDLALELALLWVGGWTRDLQRYLPAPVILWFCTFLYWLCCIFA